MIAEFVAFMRHSEKIKRLVKLRRMFRSREAIENMWPAQALPVLPPLLRLTIYPEAGYDSWTETYNNPQLYTWLLEHRRPH